MPWEYQSRRNTSRLHGSDTYRKRSGLTDLISVTNWVLPSTAFNNLITNYCQYIYLHGENYACLQRGRPVPRVAECQLTIYLRNFTRSHRHER